jgi:hypothetical protein
MKYVFIAIAIAIGVAGFIFGGYDDSPGLQGLCLLLVAGVVFYAIRTRRRT